MQHNATVARGSSFALTGLLISAALQYAQNIGVARLFGAERTGYFVFAISLAGVAATVGMLGAQETVLRYVAAFRGSGEMQKLRGVLLFGGALTLVGSSVLACVLYFAAPAISAWGGNPAAAGVVRALTFTIPPLALIVVLAAALQGVKRLDFAALARDIGRPLALFAAVLIVWAFSLSFETMLALYALGLVVALAFALALVRHIFPELKQARQARYQTGPWLRFSLSVTLMDVFRSANRWGDTLVLAFFISAAQLAIYYSALRTAIFIGIIVSAFSAILSPLAADLWHRQEIGQLDEVYKTTTRWAVTAGLPVAAAILALSQPLMRLFGAEFEAGIPVLVIILVGQIGNVLTGGVGRLLIMTGHERIELVNTLLTIVLLIGGLWLFAPRYGMIGAAAVNAAVVLVINLLKLLQVWRFIGIHPYQLNYWKPIAASVGVAFLGMFMANMLSGRALIVELTVVSVSMAAAYLFLLAIFGLEPGDKAVLMQMKAHLFSGRAIRA